MIRRLAPLAMIAVALMGASSSRYRAGINPTVASHLEYAGQAARDGRGEEAKGYAKALLIGEEITYAVAFDPGSEEHRETAMEALNAAADTWREALGGTVTVRAARDGETPNLVIHFEPEVEMQGRAVSGYIRWRRTVQNTSAGWIGKFEGQVFARTHCKGKPMPFAAMRCCLGHEMGHMFGLPDAHPNAKDDDALMGPLNLGRPVSGPNETEVETVRHIRQDASEIERLAGTKTENQIIVELDGSHR